MARAIPLPGGWGMGGDDLFKGCRDQNENQLALGFCPFYNVGRASQLIGWPLSFSQCRVHSLAGRGWIGVKVEKVEMHRGMEELSRNRCHREAACRDICI